MQKTYQAQNWQRLLDPQQLQAVYDRQGWTGPAGQYRQRSVDRLAACIEGLHHRLRRPVRIIDVACFTADYFGRLDSLPQLAGKFSYVGVDVTPRYVQAAAGRWCERPHASFAVASAVELPYRTGEFDLSFNSGMLIHVDQAARCVAEVVRVASRVAMIEATIRPGQAQDWVEENKSGECFIDRVYRAGFIRRLVGRVAVIANEVQVPYRHDCASILIEALPHAAAAGLAA